MLKNFFCDHPHSVGESYSKHCSMAFGFGVTMILGGLACCLHAIFPFMFKDTASKTVHKLYGRMKDRGNMPQQEEKATQDMLIEDLS